jgi:hypothetical protein
MSSQSLRSSALLAALFVGAAVTPSSLRAQQSAAADRGNPAAQASTVATPAPLVAADSAPAAGPRFAPAGIRPVQAALALNKPLKADSHIGAGSNLALMGVGAAGIVVGLLVGGDGGTFIALTGAVIGLVGLYRYIR